MSLDQSSPSELPSEERLTTDLEELSTIRSDEAGWTRTVFSDPYRASRDWIRARMEQAGLEVHGDSAGNLVGILAGTNPAAPALITGSHTDTVQAGGRFDGSVGVLGAIEVARRLRETGTRLTRDLIVIDFLGEEPNDFGLSCLGSRALSGGVTGSHLDRRDHSGHTLGESYAAFGLDPNAVLGTDWLRRRRPHRYVELHIEQGPLLERRGSSIGIVTAIAGIERLLVKFSGRSDHAGTMPMSDRRDALVAAAEAVLTINREGCGAPVHGVATTSRIDTVGSPNVVPGTASLSAEMRSIDPDWLSSTKIRLAEEIRDSAQERGVDVAMDWWTDNTCQPTSTSIQDTIADVADAIGLSWEAVPSGATHDAVHLAGLCPMGMIFVPSRDGRSHCPEEYTPIEDITTGVRVLAATLQRLDAQDR